MTYAVLLHHLWQSTACILIAWALTLALRKNRAAVRHWLWLAASLKFLVPLSLLVSLGSQFGLRTATSSAQPQLSVFVNQISGPAGFAPVTAVPVSTAPDRLPAVLFGVWICGAAIVLLVWFRSWWNIRALRQAATPLDLNLPIPVMSSAARLEPGVFGVFKPVLLLPEGIANRLTPDQLETVLAHELCHVRRRDNLTAVLHMLVETLFWFHPLVWWIGNRLAEERERACDEAVLQSAGEPEVYAEGILQVCRLYLESPIACMSGISGADLRARIQRIMSGARAHNITLGRKLLLATVALVLAWVPLLIGVLTPRVGRAESPAAKLPEFEVASVKPVEPNVFHMVGARVYPGGRVVLSTLSLKDLITVAFRLSYWQVSGGDAWVGKDAYNIEAKPPADVRPSIKDLRYTLFGIEDKRLREMLQSLLIDRFRLQFHRETKTGGIYLLQRNGKPLRLRPTEIPPAGAGLAADRSSFGSIGYAGGTWVISATTMPQLADFASAYYLHAPVLDRTELNGLFDYRQPAADEEPNYSDNSESFQRLLSELGLKLVRSKGPVEVFIIDRAEKPSQN